MFEIYILKITSKAIISIYFIRQNYNVLIMSTKISGFSNFILQFIKVATTVFLVVFVIDSYGINHKKDSLYSELRSAKSDRDKYRIHFQLSAIDSSLYHLDKAEEFAKNDHYIIGIVEAANNRAIYYNDLAEYDKALEILNSALEWSPQISDPNLMGRLLGNIGNVYSYKNYHSKAIEYYSRAIVFFEKENNELGLANLYGMLGNVKYKNQNYNDAIDSYNSGRLLFIKLGIKGGEVVSEMNIGNCHKKLNEVDSAFVYYNRALEKYNALGNMPYYKAMCLANIGNLYALDKEFVEAEKYLLEAEKVFSQINNSYSIAQINLDLADVYLRVNKLNLAYEKINKGREIVEEQEFYYLKLNVNRLLWDYYKHKEDYQSAHYWLNEYMLVNDSLQRIDRNENVDFILAQFETERKEREIEILKKNDEISQLMIRRKTLNLYFVVLGLTIALVFIGFLYKSFRRVKRMNNLLAFQNVEIGQQKEEITSQRDEIESQCDMLEDQNEVLERFQTHTNQSLRYAQSIQAAILPSDKILQQISSEFFVIIKPCELVSGDFFWATVFDDYRVFCVADCTGHGVPGAFMSILGITALNDIVSRHKVSKPNEILGYLKESVIEALSQNDPEQLHKDGMDIALCVFNTKTRELQFAGAGLPLWVVSNELPESILMNCVAEPINKNGFTLCEFKGDIMPVGQSPLNTEFTNHSFKLDNSSISVYLSTDGYIDQRGGKEGKKFQKRQLLEQIISIQDNSFEDQKQIVENTFQKWMGNYSQIDDVTILGIKL